MRTLISSFLIAFFVSATALWALSVPSSEERDALIEQSQRTQQPSRVAQLTP